MLALSELVDHASAVLPLENQALLDIVRMVDASVQRSKASSAGPARNLLGPGALALFCLFGRRPVGIWASHRPGPRCTLWPEGQPPIEAVRVCREEAL